MGWIKNRLLRTIAIQAEGCAPVVNAYRKKSIQQITCFDASTTAAGIRGPKPLGDKQIYESIHEPGCCAVAVQEASIIKVSLELAKQEGIITCLEGAAGVSAISLLIDMKLIDRNEQVVISNTGAGLNSPWLRLTRPLTFSESS